MASYDKPNRSQFFNGPLYDKMAEDLQLSGKAQRTVHGYLRAVRQLADHCRKAPDQISEQELRRYFLYLRNQKKSAYGTLRVALSGIQFFYRTTCPRDWQVLSMLKLKNESTLPEVITRQQVRQIILAANTQRMRAFFWTACHPHVHRVAPGCVVVLDTKGKPTEWKATPTNFLMRHATLIREYKTKLADALKAANLFNNVPAKVWRKKFVVDLKPVDKGHKAVAYLAPYVHRVAISDHRIKAVTESSVTYQYKPKKSKKVLSRTVPGEAFVKSFAQHILPSGFRKVRYYGWMASNSRTKWEELRMLVWFSVGWVYWLASGHAPQEPIKPIPKVCCAACGATMRVIEITNQPTRPTLSCHTRTYLDSG